jgi:peptidyl-dipeptidase Dcp
MENWCYQPEALALFAKHYETGTMLPTEYIDKIKESQTFLEGYMTLRQLNFGYLDMSWHDRKDLFEGDVASHEKAATERTSLFEAVKGTRSSTAFSHIFQGGYSAGYYSYKWAEVLDADAFERFEEEGLFSPKVAADFALILQSGGTVAPDELYRKFRGRDPKVDALIKRAGISA